MRRVTFKPSARQDLREIWDFIAAQDGVEPADRFAAFMEEKCGRIATTPKIGRARDDLVPGLRTFPTGDYVIAYHETDYGIDVLGVIHAARDFPTFFRTQDR
ncbi:MAG: type II toxin-antitoxin system RelE/ParE family toxin [Patescibacteria group bacterium]